MEYETTDQRAIRNIMTLMSMLSGRRGVTIDEIAHKLEVSQRTAYRYVSSLRDAGFVVAKDNDGYVIEKMKGDGNSLADLVHFSEQEEELFNEVLLSLQGQGAYKENLKRKLVSLFNFKTVPSNIVASRNKKKVEVLSQAMKEKKVVLLCKYKSGNSGTIGDRRVEPFGYNEDYSMVWAYDHKDRKNKTFNIENFKLAELLEDEDWRFEAKHVKDKSDVFHTYGNNPIRVVMRLDVLALKQLESEFFKASEYVRPDGRDHWILDVKVYSLLSVGRFVMGLLNHIEILDSEELTGYIDGEIRKYEQRKKEKSGKRKDGGG